MYYKIREGNIKYKEKWITASQEVDINKSFHECVAEIVRLITPDGKPPSPSCKSSAKTTTALPTMRTSNNTSSVSSSKAKIVMQKTSLNWGGFWPCAERKSKKQIKMERLQKKRRSATIKKLQVARKTQHQKLNRKYAQMNRMFKKKTTSARVPSPNGRPCYSSNNVKSKHFTETKPDTSLVVNSNSDRKCTQVLCFHETIIERPAGIVFQPCQEVFLPCSECSRDGGEIITLHMPHKKENSAPLFALLIDTTAYDSSKNKEEFTGLIFFQATPLSHFAKVAVGRVCEQTRNSLRSRE